MTESIYAWHFLPEGGRTRFNNLPVEAGKPLIHVGPIELCESGLHASVRLENALAYAPGPILCRVRCHGAIKQGHDKLVSSHRTVLWMFDASSVLRLWACWCVRNTKLSNGKTTWDLLTDVRSRNAVEVAERFAAGMATKEELDAAWDAAWDAAGAAARAAAWAAWDAAWAAAGAAARAAAWAAAWAAAGAATGAAAWARLEEMVIEESKRLGVWREDREEL